MAWGPGCLLGSSCKYNDPLGAQYQGKRAKDEHNRDCIPWHPPKQGYTGDKFPEKDLRKASNYCRNPSEKNGHSRSPWCYYNSAIGHFGYCTIQDCDCPAGRFGINCVSECHCNDQNNICVSGTGHCTNGECHGDFQGLTCQECKDKRFGVHCDRSCRCQNQTEVCDKTTGYCQSGCPAGWMGVDCHTECPLGSYGLNCTSICSANCNPPGDCDKKTGACPCKVGYQPPACVDECPQGKYGLNCTYDCSMHCDPPRQCDKMMGHCSCKAGYQPHLCVDECGQGLYGYNCTGNCSQNCDTPGQCDKASGICPCQAGYEPPRCVDDCVQGQYGLNCLNTCSVNCDPSGQCNKRSGTCLCKVGYRPPLCVDACAVGMYGMNCTTQCSTGCEEVCHNVNGTCTCKNGYKGTQCSEVCDMGAFGKYCQEKCAVGCQNSSCNAETGECLCKENFRGSLCAEELRSNFVNGVIVPATVVPVFLIAVTVVLVVVWLRRRAGRKRNSSQGNNAAQREILDIQKGQGLNAAPERFGNMERKAEGNRLTCDRREERERYPEDDNVYCNLSSTFEKTDIGVDVFPDYIKHMIDTDQSFEDEYKSIPDDPSANCSIGKKAENMPKNRFKNIIPYDHNRVKLYTTDDDPIKGYVNASFIPGYDDSVTFIAAQGPVPVTVNDFVLLLWENNIQLAVMLTSLKENNKVKCERYWPEGKEPMTFGHITLSLRKGKYVQKNPYYITRELILQKDGKTRRVKHMQFTSWPDHGSPLSPAAFLSFHQETKTYYDTTKGPVLVHCSAGVGRTGTFLAIDYLLRQAEKEATISIYNCVVEMRKHRVNMVQSLDQYKFLHEAVLEALHCGKVIYDAAEFEAWRIHDHCGALQKQFAMLEKLRRLPRPGDTSSGRHPNNKNKNRELSLLPLDRWRPLLMMKVPATTDYINAVFVKTTCGNDGILVTQSPMENTVIDLWRLIYDYECHVVVALNTFESGDCPKYIPSSTDMYGPFHVAVKSTIEEDGCIKTSLTYTVKQEQTELVHMAVCEEPSPGALPDIATFLALIQGAHYTQYDDIPGRILVHCRNGLVESGLFCALSQICHKIKEEGEVDIFHAVKQIRNSRPEFITSLEEYQWLHEAACHYVRSFSTYANFH